MGGAGRMWRRHASAPTNPGPAVQACVLTPRPRSTARAHAHAHPEAPKFGPGTRTYTSRGPEVRPGFAPFNNPPDISMHMHMHTPARGAATGANVRKAKGGRDHERTGAVVEAE